jgi:hypothetical protein
LEDKNMATLKTWTFAADGTGAWHSLDQRISFVFSAFGTYGSGTLKVYASPDNGTTAIEITALESTANIIAGPVNLPQGYLIRPVLTGSTAPSITAHIAETVS